MTIQAAAAMFAAGFMVYLWLHRDRSWPLCPRCNRGRDGRHERSCPFADED